MDKMYFKHSACLYGERPISVLHPKIIGIALQKTGYNTIISASDFIHLALCRMNNYMKAEEEKMWEQVTSMALKIKHEFEINRKNSIYRRAIQDTGPIFISNI